MKIRIDGRELLVKKTTRGIVDLQRQTGWKLSELTQADTEGYAAAMAAFFALSNAGFSPSWDDLIDRDIEEFEMVKEPGDERASEDDASDPQKPLEGSDPGGDDPPEA